MAVGAASRPERRQDQLPSVFLRRSAWHSQQIVTGSRACANALESVQPQKMLMLLVSLRWRQRLKTSPPLSRGRSESQLPREDSSFQRRQIPGRKDGIERAVETMQEQRVTRRHRRPLGLPE